MIQVQLSSLRPWSWAAGGSQGPGAPASPGVRGQPPEAARFDASGRVLCDAELRDRYSEPRRTEKSPTEPQVWDR